MVELVGSLRPCAMPDLRSTRSKQSMMLCGAWDAWLVLSLTARQRDWCPKARP